MFEYDDDHRKKIESTRFIFLVAPPGTGKSFSGDYLELFCGWKHVDGDTPLKTPNKTPKYQDLTDRTFQSGPYEGMDREFFRTEGLKPYMEEIARLTLEAARESDKVVLSWACMFKPMRSYLRQILADAGANVTMIVLQCDFVAHMNALWKRHCRQAEQAGITIAELIGGITNVDDFIEFEKSGKGWYAGWESIDDSEEPFVIVDVTPKDETVLDILDAAAGTPSSGRSELSMEEIVKKVQAADIARDKKMFEAMKSSMSHKERKVFEKEPEKYVARRSSLLEVDKRGSISRLSITSNDSTEQTSKRRQSFIETGIVLDGVDLEA